MPRLGRNFIQTSYFHVITQGISKRYIFEYSEDIKYYIAIMDKLNCEQQINLIAYCIMNNHAHFLIETKDIAELSKYMQRLNTKYAMYYNNKYERVGYVFRDRYKCEGIYNNEHLYNCVKYILNNPIKAGICKNAEEYPYSYYQKINYCQNEEHYDFLEIDENIENKKITCKKVIDNFLHVNNMYLTDLEINKQKLKELVTVLKNDYSVSLRQIAQETNLNREMVRKIYKS